MYIFNKCLLGHCNFEESLSLAVNTPGDSDSIANLVGALIGAYEGYEKSLSRIDLFHLLEDKKELEESASRLAGCL